MEHHELDDELIFWKCDQDIGPIKAGSPIELCNNGSAEVRISDWSNPKKIHFNRVRMFDTTTEFGGGDIRLRGYIKDDVGAFELFEGHLSLFKPA